MEQFRGGLVFKAHRLLYHSTPGSRVIKKKKKRSQGMYDEAFPPVLAGPKPEAFQPLQVQNGSSTPLERASFRSMGRVSFSSVGTAAAHARALQGSKESMIEILLLNLSSVHFVHTSGLILDR